MGNYRISVELKQLIIFILAILEVVWFILKLLNENFCVDPVRYFFIKLVILYSWIVFNCFLSIFFRIDPLLVNKHYPMRRPQVLNLFLKVRNALGVNSVFIVAKLGVIIMTRQEKGLQAHIVILALITYNIDWLLFIVPVNAKHASLWICSQRLQRAFWLLLNWIKLFVVFVCAVMVFQDALKFIAITLAISSKNPLYILMVTFLPCLKEVFNCNSYSEFSFA